MSISEHNQPLLEDIGEALSSLSCPYLQSGGVCTNGCWEEPRCYVNEPVGGWITQIKEAAVLLKEEN